MTGKLVQRTWTSESLPLLLPKLKLESLLWEFNCTGELSLLYFNVSLTEAVNVGSVGYHCFCLLRNEPKMQKVYPELDLEFKHWRAWGYLDLLNVMNRETT